ncbi:hypothetical protein [Williamsia phyllosphaerae]|uniref:hypothetical protein n=1 Tax=Williamsia phyllosphaerae TaxID=885042 RepID=UPI00166A23A2|nr:hypothetical protein [Williamsia phyllosphaerae]
MDVQTRQEEFYFGPEELALYGVLHLPVDDRVRGAVLICGSIAKEQTDACRGLRMLGDALARRRIAVMRFDYAGTGDSADCQVRHDTVARWCASIGLAVDHLAGLGIESITGIGLRVGSLLLDAVLPDQPRIDRVVHWDPVGRGRSFVREQQALHRLSVAAEDGYTGENVPLIGATLSSTAAKELSEIEFVGSGDHVRARLMATRPEVTDKRVRAVCARPEVDVVTVEGMPEFIAPDSFLVALPVAAIDEIVEWVDTRTTTVVDSIDTTDLRHDARMSVPNPLGGSSTEVVEHIEHIGAHGLFAVRTSPADARTTVDNPKTVVFFATANDLHVGPNREWVDLARQVAAAGGQALRFDRTGAGETGPVVAGPTSIYSTEAIGEALAAVRHASSDPSRVLVTGVCSGSWYSAYVARELHTGAAVLINSIAWSWRRKRSAEGNVRPEDLGVPRSDPEWQKTPRARIKSGLRRRLPYPLWRELGRRGITQIPEILVRPLVKAGVDTTLVLSPHDYGWYVDQRGPEGLARIDPTMRRPRLISVGSGDHSAFHESVRTAVRAPILDWITSP